MIADTRLGTCMYPSSDFWLTLITASMNYHYDSSMLAASIQELCYFAYYIRSINVGILFQYDLFVINNSQTFSV